MDARKFNKRKKNGLRAKRLQVPLSEEEQQQLYEIWQKEASYLPLSSYVRYKLFKN